jgi:hypothetical protein
MRRRRRTAATSSRRIRRRRIINGSARRRWSSELPGGYLWTHLGYTYDWAPDHDRYGASEYVIRAGAPALIVGNVTAEAYCRLAKP